MMVKNIEILKNEEEINEQYIENLASNNINSGVSTKKEKDEELNYNYINHSFKKPSLKI